jgi:hypothetical protein
MSSVGSKCGKHLLLGTMPIPAVAEPHLHFPGEDFASHEGHDGGRPDRHVLGAEAGGEECAGPHLPRMQ